MALRLIQLILVSSMSQPGPSQTAPPEKEKKNEEKESQMERNGGKKKDDGESLDGRKGKGKASDTAINNPATTSAHFAPSSEPTSTHTTKTRAQKANEQVMTDKGKRASSSKAKATNSNRPTPASHASKVQAISWKKGSPARNERDDQNQQPAAVCAVTDPHLFSIAQKLPVDVLSLITLESSQEEWIVPLTISQVCQLWRVAALATPAAWARIQIGHRSPPGPKFLDLWLSRCGSLTCQLSFPPLGAFSALEVACSRAEVLKGLSIFRSTKVLSGSFPNLEELRVSGYCPARGNRGDIFRLPGPDITYLDNNLSCLLQASRFPSLRVLHLHSLSNVVMTAMARRGLPPLEELHIHATCSSWEDIAFQCAASLVTLGIRYDGDSISSSRPQKLHSVTFPILTSLSIVVDSLYGIRMEPESLTPFKTPSLRNYFEKQCITSAPFRSPIHQDTFNISTAIFVQADRVDWTKLPHLIHMTIWAGDQRCRQLCDSLRDNARQAPSISEIQWVSSRPTQTRVIKKSLEERRQVTGKAVNFQVVRERQYQPPKETYEKVCVATLVILARLLILPMQCFTYLPGIRGLRNGDIFDEGSEWYEDEWEENYFDYEEDYSGYEDDNF
ncbi:hypothetical protein FRC17_011300 [Serendipita sp. 399]|nr:hypothetical protein FRC17_011300 [Serendipita sp. 399]